MSLLSDEQKVHRFIKNNEPCPTEFIIAYYLKCKRNDTQIPQEIDIFIDAILEKIFQDRNHGYNPDFNKIFGFKNIVGRKKSELAKENRILLIGFGIEVLMEGGETYEKAAELVADKMGLGAALVKQEYTKYKKIPHTLDGLDTEER
jgi:hypothetical protein